MISDIQKAIDNALSTLYPAYTLYNNYVPQKFKTPSFRVRVFEHAYSKQLADTYKGVTSFDVAFFSALDAANIEADCLSVQETLMRGLDLCSGFRILNKDAKITDNVLHITLDVKYSERLTIPEIPMQSLDTNSSLKE
jgi:hypothetical protein